MIFIAISFFITSFCFFIFPHVYFTIFICVICFFALKYRWICPVIISSIVLFSCYSNIFYPISCVLKNNFNIVSPTIFTIILFSFVYSLFFYIKFNTNKNNVLLLYPIVLLLFFKYFAYNIFIFFAMVLLVIVSTAQNINLHKSTARFNIAYFLTFVVIINVSSLLITQKDIKKSIFVLNNSAVWATSNVNYDKNDWTLVSGYSYSLFDKFISSKYEVFHSNTINDLFLKHYDYVFYMTPTVPFSENEKNSLDKYIKNGGHVVFVADHTDLYGHARVINDYIGKYNIFLEYNAIYNSKDKNTKIVFSSFPEGNIRPLTGCGVKFFNPSYIRGHFFNFVGENADYTKPNFFAEMRWTPDDEFGIYPFLVSIPVSNGAITICVDSTIFSNFGIFHPNILPLISNIFSDISFQLFFCKYFFLILICVLCFLICCKFTSCSIIAIIFYVATYSWSIDLKDYNGFYDKNKELKICCPENIVYDSQVRNSFHSRNSISNLLSNLARFDIYPRYVNKFQEIFQNNDILYIDSNLKAKFRNKTIDLSNYSDFYLGSWWSSIDISPYRKHMFSNFVDFLKNNHIKNFQYPEPSLTGKNKTLILKNSRGEIKKLKYDSITFYLYLGKKYIFLGDGVWGMYAKENGVSYIIGGDSLNDTAKDEINFFKSAWFAELDIPAVLYSKEVSLLF